MIPCEFALSVRVTSARFDARKLAAMPDVRLVAVVDQDTSRAQQLGQELPPRQHEITWS